MKKKLLLSSVLAAVALLAGESVFAASGALDNTWYKFRFMENVKPNTAFKYLGSANYPDPPTVFLINQAFHFDTGQPNGSSHNPAGCYLHFHAAPPLYESRIFCYSTMTKSWQFMPTLGGGIKFNELSDTGGVVGLGYFSQNIIVAMLESDRSSFWTADGKTFIADPLMYPPLVESLIALTITPPTGKQKLPLVSVANAQNYYIKYESSNKVTVYVTSKALAKGGSNSFAPADINEVPQAAKDCVTNQISGMPTPMAFCVEDKSIMSSGSGSSAPQKFKGIFSLFKQ